MNMAQLRARIKSAGVNLTTIADRVGVSRQLLNDIMHRESGVKNNIALALDGLKKIYKDLGRLIHDLEKETK